MSKKYVLSCVAAILVLLVLTSTYALYRQDADEKVVSITFGEIYELSIGGGESPQSTKINPDNPTGSINVELNNEKVNSDGTSDQYTYGKFYVEIISEGQSLANMLNFSAKQGDVEVANHDTLVKPTTGEPKGYVIKLGSNPVSLEVTYTLSDAAKTNYLEYAGQSVKVVFHWEFTEELSRTINVYNRWRGNNINYYFDGDLSNRKGTISHFVDDAWAVITVPASVNKITFKDASNNESNESTPIVVDLSQVTAKEVWTLFGENEATAAEVHVTNPEERQ